jgi:hypothetical protein
MQMIGWLMIALFVWLFHGPWLSFKRAVDSEDWPSAGAGLSRIRQIIAVNLPLGLLVVVIGASGALLGLTFRRTWHAALCVARLDLIVGEDLWGTFGVGGNWVLPAYAATAGEKSSFTTRLEPAR